MGRGGEGEGLRGGSGQWEESIGSAEKSMPIFSAEALSTQTHPVSLLLAPPCEPPPHNSACDNGNAQRDAQQNSNASEDP